ncbi:hypothetical protein H5410_056595 [Solanum commersonii]|uniref:Uncharacterized protein n=1 Tax=Solanum commersonii TaxID=4109 RepID=A0A9J5WM66_SOLCO|nr:hypothetical protein H5410_056595 [Solanum commersonii]
MGRFVHQDLNYGVGWSGLANKVKRSPEVIRISTIIFVKVFCGRPSKPQLWSRLIQTERGYFGNPDFRRLLAKKIPGRQSKT